MSDTVLRGDHQVVPFRPEPPKGEGPFGRLCLGHGAGDARTLHRTDRQLARVRGAALVVAGAPREWELLLATARTGPARAAAGLCG